MSQFIDRRLNGKNKNAVNRQRFIRRFKKQIKKAVTDTVAKRSIKDVNNGDNISIPSRDIFEPTFHHDRGGLRETIYPGNVDFISGDRIKRPPSNNQGTGSEASNSGESVDDFAFEISREEFLELFFEDLALPDLIKTQIAKIPNYTSVRSGFTSDGIPSNINVTRSLRSALSRKIALTSGYRGQLKELQEKLERLNQQPSPDSHLVQELLDEIELLQKRIKAVPFIDTFDLRYNNRVKVPKPSTQAVMFCIMDVSGSMDEMKKDIAKRFFILLYLFLQRNYEKIEVVFIRHHTSAKEVDEEEFFYSRETGGTVVSSALELVRDIILARYPTSDWNIYSAQASDGDNWNADSPYCQELLIKEIMPNMQYYAYVEIMPRHHQSLWESYLIVKERCPQFSMQNIESLADIYPVFRELFKREMV